MSIEYRRWPQFRTLLGPTFCQHIMQITLACALVTTILATHAQMSEDNDLQRVSCLAPLR